MSSPEPGNVIRTSRRSGGVFVPLAFSADLRSRCGTVSSPRKSSSLSSVHRIGRSASSAHQTEAGGVFGIARSRQVLKIVGAIVRLCSILVIDLHRWGSRTNERLCDQQMDGHRLDRAAFGQAHSCIAFDQPRSQNPSRKRVSAGSISPNSANIRDAIEAFIPDDGSPLLTYTLSHRNQYSRFREVAAHG